MSPLTTLFEAPSLAFFIPRPFLHSSVTLITIWQTVLLVSLLSIPTPAQCQFSPLHFKFHESRALFCSPFSGILRRSIKEWMKCQLQITVEKMSFRRLNSASMTSNKDSEFSQRSVLFESHRFNKNFTCTGLPSKNPLPVQSQYLYTPSLHPNSSCSCLPCSSASEFQP